MEKETMIDQARAASGWLGKRLDDLREEVREADRELERVRNKTGTNLTGTKDSRLIQIEQLTQQLAGAEAQFAQTQAKLEKVKSIISNNGDLSSLSDVTSNRVIQGFRGREADLLRRKAVLSKRYGPNHPEMIAVNEELSTFRDKIQAEITTIIETLENQAAIDRNSINELKRNMAEYRQSYQNDAENRMEIRELQTKSETARALLNSFMASYLESQQRLNLDKDPLRVITPATIPLSPSYPKKSLIVMLSGLTGLFMGIFIALLMERIQYVFQNARQVENYLGIPVYGVLPRMKNTKKLSPMEYILEKPASSLAEMVRSLYMAIKLRDPHRKSGGRVITLTSTMPDEGKTTTASWLATVASQAGEKVLIVDADMRRPSLHKSFDIGNNRGIADYLSDRLPLDDTIYKKHSSGVHIMTGKAIPTHALTLLTSERMESMVRRLRDMYDLIIIDAPTSMIFSDSRVVAKLSDKTFYIIEWKKTRRDHVLTCIKQFTDMNYKDLAVILSKTDKNNLLTRKNGDLAYLYQSQS